jgi:hypothetical protein
MRSCRHQLTGDIIKPLPAETPTEGRVRRLALERSAWDLLCNLPLRHDPARRSDAAIIAGSQLDS